MSHHLPHSFFLDIQKDKTFLENWGPLLEFKKLYVPIGEVGVWSINPENLQDVLDFIDVSGVEVSPDFCVGYAFTDPNLVDDDILLAEIPMEAGLCRFYQNQAIGGLTFNAPSREEDGQQEAFTVYRYYLPRLVGLLRTPRPEALASEHVQLADQALSGDRAYLALYHACLARELGAAVEDYFCLEFEALFDVNLRQEAASFLEWGSSRVARDVVERFYARLMSISGKPLDALELLKPYFKAGNPAAPFWLERGRALLIDGRPQEAVPAFEQCLARDGANVSAILGKGLALRGIHYPSANKEGLEQALQCFTKVREVDGFHTAEALHHMGTIYLAFEDWQSAEDCFEESLSRAPSPVTKRNLSIVLHAQGRADEGRRHFDYLRQYFPHEAEGIEDYYPQAAQTYVVQVGEPVTEEELNKRSLSAREYMREWQITMSGDIMDFRRFDSYVSYYAPTGEFLQNSPLGAMDEAEQAAALLECSLHLAGVLVRGGYASWVLPESGRIEDVRIEMTDGMGAPSAISLFGNVYQRVQAGASYDNLTNMDMLVSLVPDYDKLSEDFVDPFPAFPADEERVEEFKRYAKSAVGIMKKFGFNLTGELSDLYELEYAIGTLYEEKGVLHKAISEGQVTSNLFVKLGFYLGFIVKKYSDGKWYDHSDLSGISLQEMPIGNVYPIWKMAQRIQLGPEGNEFTSLTALEPPLVCADLIRKVKKAEIETREQLQALLSQMLPSVVDEDPSGASLGRMVDMISISAGKTNWH